MVVDAGFALLRGARSSALIADRDIGEENRLPQIAAMFCFDRLPSYQKATLIRRDEYRRK
jgi:hypothetical protein